MPAKAVSLHKSEYFELRRMRRRGSDKIFYEVRCTGWIPSVDDGMSWPEQVRDIIDPLRVKSGDAGRHWKFRNRKDAEQVYTVLTLKWP